MKKINSILVFTLCLFSLNSYSQYIWEEVLVPDNADVKMIAFDSVGVHYIASNKGVYISEYGYQWEQSSLPDYVSYIYINENNTIYTGMNTLFRSFDNGITWDSIFYSPSGGITSLCSKGDSNIFLGTWGSIYRSIDSGQTWVEVVNASNSEVFNAIVGTNVGTLFAGSTNFTASGSPGGVYRSEDNGTTWLLSNLNYHFASSMAVNTNDEIYVSTKGHYYNGGGRVFKSNNNGISWDTIYEFNLINSIALNSYDEIAIGCATQGYPGGVFFSNNDGGDWDEISNNIPYSSFDQVIFSPNSHLYAITHFDDKLYRTQTIVDSPNYLIDEAENSLEVFPNPAKDQIKIRSGFLSNCIVTITNVSGIKIIETNTRPTNGLTKLSVERLAPGLYYLQCINSLHEVKSCKFIKY